MTTYCQNLFTIATNETTDGIPLNLYEDIVHSSSYLGLAFETLLPIPENTEDEVAWRIKNWGTHGISGTSGKIRITEEEFVTFRFETWETSPLPWVQHISSLYDDLIFDISYLNIINNTAGSHSFISGVEVENITSTATLSFWQLFGYTEEAYNLFAQNSK
jgi:hypothetical protein